MIHILDLHFQTEHTIASFVVETEEGPVMVETGPYSTFGHLEDGLAKIGYKPSDIKHVFLSHIHFDHAGAAWAMARAGAKIYVHPFGYKHLLAPEKLYGSAKRIYGDMMESLWGEMQPIPENQLVAVEDEQSFQVGNHEFKAWHTPGHAVHHIAWERDKVVFTGDVAGVCINGGPVVPPCPPPDINVEAWIVSIDKVRRLKPSRLYLTHFGIIEDVPHHLNNLVKRLETYANWMKKPFDEGRSVQEVTPEFQAFANQELIEAGLDKSELARYDAANPAFMSVAGLMRYWKKKTEKG